MKTLFIRTLSLIILLLVILVVNTKATDHLVSIYTPMGSLVSDTYSLDELSLFDRWMMNSAMDDAFPNAIRLDGATRKYNCHAYAWYVSEGGSEVWIGGDYEDSEDIFWEDGSYIKTCANIQSKVSYASDNHSAVKIGTSDVFVSKWGPYGLYQHNKDYCPYDDDQLKYFISSDVLSVSGVNSICASQSTSITVNNLPSCLYMAWNKSSNLTNVYGGYNFTAFYGIGNGVAWVEPKVPLEGGGYLLLPKKYIWIGAPIFEIVGDNTLSTNDWGSASLEYDGFGGDGMGITDVTWTYMGPPLTLYPNSTTIDYNSSSYTGIGYIYADASNACGSYNNEMYYQVNSSGKFAILNDEKSKTINITKTENIDPNSKYTTISNDNELINVQLWNSMNGKVLSLDSKDNNININTSNLTSGLYIVVIKTKNSTVSEKVIIQN